MVSDAAPAHGEVWIADLRPARGHEQDGTRPVLVVSLDPFNHPRRGLVVTVPLTTTFADLPSHVRISPPEGGITRVSYALCEHVRSISHVRLGRRLGKVSPRTMASVSDPLRHILGI
jgi:mRNA interferase MazF